MPVLAQDTPYQHFTVLVSRDPRVSLGGIFPSQRVYDLIYFSFCLLEPKYPGEVLALQEFEKKFEPDLAADLWMHVDMGKSGGLIQFSNAAHFFYISVSSHSTRHKTEV